VIFRKNRILPLLALFCALALFGCAAERAAACREYKIYCGMTSERGEVSEAAWQRFCDRYVSAAFPDGYTVVDATGYWRSSAVAAKERSKVIVIVAPAAACEKVRSVARRYREEFGQQAVLISASDADMELVRANDARGK